MKGNIYESNYLYHTNRQYRAICKAVGARNRAAGVYPCRRKKAVLPGGSVIYLGWIMADCIKGYAAAARRYSVCAVCGVGMGQTGTQEDSVRKKTAVPANIPLFTLQGGFNVKKLHGIYRLLMEIMVKTAGRGLAAKENRTQEENDMFDMMLNGGKRVRFENLRAVFNWYVSQKQKSEEDL